MDKVKKFKTINIIISVLFILFCLINIKFTIDLFRECNNLLEHSNFINALDEKATDYLFQEHPLWYLTQNRVFLFVYPILHFAMSLSFLVLSVLLIFRLKIAFSLIKFCISYFLINIIFQIINLIDYAGFIPISIYIQIGFLIIFFGLLFLLIFMRKENYKNLFVKRKSSV